MQRPRVSQCSCGLSLVRIPLSPPEYKTANHWKMICGFLFPEKDFEKNLCESAILTRSGSLPLQERFEFSDTRLFLSVDAPIWRMQKQETGFRLKMRSFCSEADRADKRVIQLHAGQEIMMAGPEI
ncbi:hypothetical protein NB639_01400 [Oxalobacter formigenes]|uniref:hypothetical protein n=1 Tax=Oxalobacter formigenes TaxID=847 RepID=UPI0022AF6C93|nr:hypothetical protein [Oxalobacter formigenes]WAW06087.1 hypothetical protein NB639_01400 [Oxalobacter formigenes]